MPEDSTPRQLADTVIAADLRVWRRAHPDATLTEIEHVLDARLNAARAVLLAEVAAEAPAGETRCPDCGGRRARRGQRTRTLRTAGDASIELTRPYLKCLACGAGVFPPR